MSEKTQIRKLKCKDKELTYTLTRKTVKNINLRVKPDGSVCVSASQKVPIRFIEDFIRQKQDFIFTALDNYEKKRSHKTDIPRQYVNGEEFIILGKKLYLKVEEAEKESVSADAEYLYLKVKNAEDFRHKEILVTKWHKEFQKTILEEICDETYQIFQQYGVSYPEVKIRAMTSRWGSCQPKGGKITLNSKLIEAPRECIEYVVLHEFAHFIHQNHSKQFWDFVTMLMPDWKERRKKLNEIM